MSMIHANNSQTDRPDGLLVEPARSTRQESDVNAQTRAAPDTAVPRSVKTPAPRTRGIEAGVREFDGAADADGY